MSPKNAGDSVGRRGDVPPPLFYYCKIDKILYNQQCFGGMTHGFLGVSSPPAREWQGYVPRDISPITFLGCRLMVGQEILVLFIMVRIRAPQPKINKKCPNGVFLFIGGARIGQRVSVWPIREWCLRKIKKTDVFNQSFLWFLLGIIEAACAPTTVSQSAHKGGF